MEDRLPHHDVGRMRREIPGIRIIGDHDIAGFVTLLDKRDTAAVIMTGIPRRPEIDGRRDRFPVGIKELDGKILGLLHEG